MLWELRFMNVIRTSSRDMKFENFVSKLNGIHHKNFVSWMLWELRLMNVIRTSSRDIKFENYVSKLNGSHHKNFVSLMLWELRLINVIRTSSRDIRFENCILIVEFMQILTFAKGYAIYLRKTFYMQNLYLVMQKDFVYVKSECYVCLVGTDVSPENLPLSLHICVCRQLSFWSSWKSSAWEYL